MSGDFLSYLSHDDSLYNASIRKSYSNFDSFISDASSILVGPPIIRQLRIKNGNYFFYYFVYKENFFQPYPFFFNV